MGERRYAVAVGQVDIRSVCHEQAHDRGVPCTAVAEDHRFDQCRPAEAVDVVDFDRCPQQFTYDLDMAVM